MWLADDARLGLRARAAIRDPESLVHVSAASIWEAAIKAALGRLALTAGTDLAGEIVANGFIELPIAALHAAQAGALPRHHDDPFDRMLVAQAREEDLMLVTVDSMLGAYDVERLSASS